MLLIGLAAVAFIVVIWFGYPLLIRAFGAFRDPEQHNRPDLLPSVSLVLASRDDAEAIRARLSSLVAVDYPTAQLEIIVALDRRSPHLRLTDAAAYGPPGAIRVVDGDPPGGKAATLNAGVREARNDILVFADTAQRFEQDAIRALVSALDCPRVGAVSGMLELACDTHGSTNLAERYWRYERWLRNWEARVHSCVGVTGAIYAMPRRLWEPLPANLILDDLYVAMRLVLQGWRVVFTTRAVATDARRFAPAQEYRRKVRTLTGVIQVCAWLPGVLNPARNPIWLQFVFHKLLRLVTPYIVAVALVAIAWAVVAMLLSSSGGVPILLGTALLGGCLCLIPRGRRALKEQVAWAVALQSSVVVATLNGVRGKWDVWL